MQHPMSYLAEKGNPRPLSVLLTRSSSGEGGGGDEGNEFI